MANSGVVVVISGQDNTDKVFQAIEANLKRTTDRARETESALAQLGESAKRSLEVVGIAIGIRETVDLLKEAVKGSLEYGESIAKASERTGLSAGTLSVLHYAATVTNSDFDKLSNAVGRFDKTIGEAADGNKKAEAFMKSLGLNARELVNDENGAEVAFKKFSQVLAQTENPFRRAQLAAEAFGQRGGNQLIPVLQQVGENFDELKKKTQDAGLYLDNQSAAALKNQMELFKELQLRIQGVELAFTTGLIPGLDGVIKGLTGATSSTEAWNAAGKAMGKEVLSIADTLAWLIEQLRLAKAEYDSWSSHIDHAGHTFDEALGATSSQRSTAHARAENDVKRSQDAAKDYYDAKADYENQHAAFVKAFENYDKAAEPGTLRPGGKGKGFEGVPDQAEAHKLEVARKARDAAQLRLDEQMAQLRAQMAKASEEQQLAQLEDSHKRNLVSDADFYQKKLELQRQALDQQRQAALDKQKEIDAGIGKLEADARKQGGATAVEDQAKILDLRTKRLVLDGEIAKINADAAKAEIDAAQKVYELSVKQTEQVDALAAKREAIRGGDVTARLQQSADKYDIERQALIANYGAGSQQVSDADFAFTVEQDQIRAKGAEETSGLASADINARRQLLGAAEQRGQVTTLDAQRERIALDQEEARALQPVLRAYEQLAAEGDLQATEKVTELKARISELQSPVDEVAAHIRESFDGAFESLFVNLDQGLRSFENFAKGIERIVEEAAYKRFLEPLVQKGLDSLIPNNTNTWGAPKYGDAGIGGVKPIPNPGADVGGGAVKAALGIGRALGIPGLGGLEKKGGGAGITIQLVNESSLPLKIGDVGTSGKVDKDEVVAIVQNDVETGGVLRGLFAGLHL